MNLSKLQEMLKDGEAWHAAAHWVAKSQTRLNGINPSVVTARRMDKSLSPGRFCVGSDCSGQTGGRKGRAGAYLQQAGGPGRGESPAAAGPRSAGTASWCGPRLQTAQQGPGGGGSNIPQARPRPALLPRPAPPGPLSKSTGARSASRAQAALLAHSWPSGPGPRGGDRHPEAGRPGAAAQTPDPSPHSPPPRPAPQGHALAGEGMMLRWGEGAVVPAIPGFQPPGVLGP